MSEERIQYGPEFCDACHKPWRYHANPEDVCEDLLAAQAEVARLRAWITETCERTGVAPRCYACGGLGAFGHDKEEPCQECNGTGFSPPAGLEETT